jgi:hypothetical protein
MPKKRSSKKTKKLQSRPKTKPIAVWQALSREQQVERMVDLIKNPSKKAPKDMPTLELNRARQGDLEPMIRYFGKHRPFLVGLLLAGLGEQAALRHFIEAFKKAGKDIKAVKGRSAEAVKKRKKLKAKKEKLTSLIQKQIQILVGEKEYGYAAFNLQSLGLKGEVAELAKQCERHALRKKSKALMEQAVYITEKLLKDKEKATALKKTAARLK